ncbi:hypothetical protein JOM56_002219 [Amanita muscaria]
MPILASLRQRFISRYSPLSMEKSLSAAEEKRWNRFSTGMARFHDHFKEQFDTLYQLADGTFTRFGMSLPAYFNYADEFNHILTLHHTIEEREIFPQLAKRMPQFSPKNEGHIKAHEEIHDGLVRLGKLVARWKDDPKTYSPMEMRGCLDSFRSVLFRHLDEEVEDLKGENLRKYYSSLDELKGVRL